MDTVLRGRRGETWLYMFFTLDFDVGGVDGGESPRGAYGEQQNRFIKLGGNMKHQWWVRKHLKLCKIG